MTRRSRDKHVEVDAAERQAIWRANAARLSEGEHRTFLAALALTSGFGRLWDEVYVAEVRQLTGPTDETRLHEVTVRNHLQGLAARGILEWESRRGTDAKGKGFRSRLGLPKVEQTECPVDSVSSGGQTERPRDSVSPGGQTESRLGDRVRQDPHGREDLELEGSTYTPRVREDTGDEIDEAEVDRLWAASAPRGYGWEPGS